MSISQAAHTALWFPEPGTYSSQKLPWQRASSHLSQPQEAPYFFPEPWVLPPLDHSGHSVTAVAPALRCAHLPLWAFTWAEGAIWWQILSPLVLGQWESYVQPSASSLSQLGGIKFCFHCPVSFCSFYGKSDEGQTGKGTSKAEA